MVYFVHPAFMTGSGLVGADGSDAERLGRCIWLLVE